MTDTEFWLAGPTEKRPDYWKPELPFDWATGGRQLSEEEMKVARRLVKEAHDAA